MNTRDQIFSGTKEVDEKLSINQLNLEDYLKKIFGNETSIHEIKQFKGGQSNPTYMIITNQGDYVLRRQPPGKLLKSAHAVDREYRVITALGQTDVPVPRTYDYCSDENVVGTKFFLMDHVKGNIYWELLLPNLDKPSRRQVYFCLLYTSDAADE